MTTDRAAPDGWRQRLAPLGPYVMPALLALVVGAMAAVMFASQKAGHWWGDDWALYIRQSQALLDGNPGDVFDQNRFAVEMSDGAAFSPPLYPWGFPIMMAPAVLIVGADVDRLAIVQVLCAVVFACCWFALARPRVGRLPALVGMVAAAMTPLLLSWTELIQSEWPFLAVSGVALVTLDRVAASGALVDARARWWPLVVVGLGTTAAFSVRREGLAMVAAVAAAQIAAIIAARIAPWRMTRDEFVRWSGRLLVPHVTALVSVLILQLVLPSTLVPRYSGTGVSNVWKFADRHIDHLAEISGLKKTWEDDPTVLGSTVLGWAAVTCYFTAALAGIVLALTKFRARDLHLVAYAAGAFVIGASFRSAINRYLVTVAPLLLLLGLVAITTVFRVIGPRTATAVTTVLVVAICVGNGFYAVEKVDSARQFAATGSIEWGPTHPDAIAMFDEVERRTDADDVVAAPKARAMTLETGRWAIQVDDYRPIPDDVDIALIVVEPLSDIATELADPDSGFEEVWSNTRFRILRPTGQASRSARASTKGWGSSSTASP